MKKPKKKLYSLGTLYGHPLYVDMSRIIPGELNFEMLRCKGFMERAFKNSDFVTQLKDILR